MEQNNIGIFVMTDQSARVLAESIYQKCCVPAQMSIDLHLPLSGQVQQTTNWLDFPFFQENRLLHFLRKFAGNVKAYYLGKLRKNISKCRLLKVLPRMLKVNGDVLIYYIWCTIDVASWICITPRFIRLTCSRCSWGESISFKACVCSFWSISCTTGIRHCAVLRSIQSTTICKNNGI